MVKGFVSMRIMINQDKDLVEDIRARIRDNDGYCPCAIIHNDDTKCMCKAFRDEIDEGECHCGLYIKVKE